MVYTLYIYYIWLTYVCCRVGDGTVPLAIVIYIDCSYIKSKIAVKPVYITVRNLSLAVSGKSRETEVPRQIVWILLSLGPGPVTPMSVIPPYWKITISTWRVRLVFDILPMRRFAAESNNSSEFRYCLCLYYAYILYMPYLYDNPLSRLMGGAKLAR